MPSDSERKAVKTIPLMTCTNKDCSCTGMDFCNVGMSWKQARSIVKLPAHPS